MINRTIRKSASLAVTLGLTTATTLAAQDIGNIRGNVSSGETRQPVIGARVSVATPERIAVTDARGDYILRNVPAGDYMVYVSAIGRKPDSSRTRVRPGTLTTASFSMKEGSLVLSSVVVSATRTPIEATKVAATVNVLTPEQVRQSPARESQDMLRELTSVELPRTSSLVGGTGQTVSIRGVDAGRTLVLTDGFPINDAWGEWINWGRTPKAMLDRVEVVEGGTSSLYGNGAMGGVISFFTRPLAPGTTAMQVDGGSRGARHGYVAAGLPVRGALTANVFADYQEKGGYSLVTQGGGPIDGESQVIQRNGFTRLIYAPSTTWSAFGTAHLFSDSRNLGTAQSRASRDLRDANFGFDYGAYATGLFSARAFGGWQTENQTSSTPRTVTGVGRAAEDSSGRAEIPSRDLGASAVWTRSNIPRITSLSIGADIRNYSGDYNEVQYNTTGCVLAIPATCGPVIGAVSSGGDQMLSGAFAQVQFDPMDRVSVQLSGRLDRWSNTNGRAETNTPGGTPTITSYGDTTMSAFSPRIGIKFQRTPRLGYHFAYYRSFRAPNLAELYRKSVTPTQITVPNPLLEAERAEGREVGVEYRYRDWIHAKATVYVADYKNFSALTTLPGPADPGRPIECGLVQTCRTRITVTRSRSEGAEAYVAARPIEPLFLSAGVTYDDARQQSGLGGSTTNDAKPRVNRIPTPRQTIRGTWSSPLVGDWTAIWRHEGRTTTLQGVGLPPFSQWDANVQREIKRGLRGFVSAENLFDAKYFVNVAGTAPLTMMVRSMPRTIRVGVETYSF